MTDKKSEIDKMRDMRWHRQEEWGDTDKKWGDTTRQDAEVFQNEM